MHMSNFLTDQSNQLGTAENMFQPSMAGDCIKSINFLLKLSGHQHYLCALIKPEGWLWIGSDQSIVYNSIFQLETVQYSSCADIHVHKELAKNLMQYLKEMQQITLLSASLTRLKSIDAEQEFIVLLYSDHDYRPDQATWQMMNSYIEHAESYFYLKLKEEKNTLLIQALQNENSNRMKYLSFISHDLKAPFHGILGCLDILVHELDTLTKPGEAERLLHYVHDASHSTYNLLENLLGWSMSQDGRLQYRPIHFNFSDILQTVLDLLNLSAYYKNIKIKIDLDVNLYVYADMHMVVSILQNLVGNALKFMPKDSPDPITISTKIENNQAKIYVIDKGIGMNKKQLENIFSEETTLTSAGTSGEKGTGLGLILCKRFAEINQGHIVVNSELGKGTEFILSLPLGKKNY